MYTPLHTRAGVHKKSRARIAPSRLPRTAGEGMLISSGIMRRENRHQGGEGLGHRDGAEQEKSRALPRRGMRGARLNDELIVLPRRTKAHSPKGPFLSSPNGRFLHGGCVLPYQQGGGRGSADSTLPHSLRRAERRRAGGKWTTKFRPYDRSRCNEHGKCWYVISEV